MGSFTDFLFGSPEQDYQQSTLNRGQRGAHKNLIASLNGQGAGGAFGDVADYYRNNLSNNSADFAAFAAPEMRNFNQNIIPGLAEQFAGMGSGGLSSSGFRNAAVGAGTDLSERLGAIRAQLRQQSAQGLQSLGQMGLNPVVENVHRPAGEGALTGLIGQIPALAAAYFTGGASAIPGAAASAAASTPSLTGGLPKAGSTSPYGGGATSGRFNLPKFMGR